MSGLGDEPHGTGTNQSRAGARRDGNQFWREVPDAGGYADENMKSSSACGPPLKHLATAAEVFAGDGLPADIQPHGSGNIHDTFLVTLEAWEERRFILQRMNSRVFRDPEGVMRNMRRVTEHVEAKLQRLPSGSARPWQVPRVLPAKGGQPLWRDPEGECWRAMTFIAGAESPDTIQDEHHGREVGRALGMFHHLVGDLPLEVLTDTLEGLHITPDYLRRYDAVLATAPPVQTPEVVHCIRFIEARRDGVDVLEKAKARGELPLRLIHGDPKVNNILIDRLTRRSVAMVDLDTVKPGLVHYDIGDCLRSCCNPLGEGVQGWEAVRFETGICRTILEGYLGVADDFLTPADFGALYDAIRLIPFELGLRFFTDYLQGNVYFKVRHPEHNLIRALVQFQLAASIESQETSIRGIIEDLR